jgi:hypothetical protein
MNADFSLKDFVDPPSVITPLVGLESMSLGQAWSCVVSICLADLCVTGNELAARAAERSLDSTDTVNVPESAGATPESE